MAKLNLYVPDNVAKELRVQAKASGKSLSNYVYDLILKKGAPAEFDWNAHFARLDAGGQVSIPFTEADRFFGELRDISLD